MVSSNTGPLSIVGKPRRTYSFKQDDAKLQAQLHDEPRSIYLNGEPESEGEESPAYPESDEDDIESVPTKSQVGRKHEEILERVDDGSLPLKTRIERQDAVERYRRYFSRPTRNQSTLLHELLRRSKISKERKRLLKLLLKLYPKLLAFIDNNGCTPLFIAVRDSSDEVLQYLFKIAKREIVVDALKRPSKLEGNCLHVAIKEDLPILNELLDRIGDNSTVFMQTDEQGNTPLHVAVEYGRCKPTQIELVKRLVACCREALSMENKSPDCKEGLPPLRYHKFTREEAEERDRKARASAKAAEIGSGGPKDRKLGRAENSSSARPVKRVDSRIMDQETTDTNKAAKHPAEVIEEFLRLESMRNKNRMEARKLLYGTGQKREIEFSLGGRSIITDTALNFMKGHLKFEKVLQYVAISNLQVDCASSEQDHPSGQGRTDYCSIFQWLRERNVDQILRVVVQDNHPISARSPVAHSDAAIEHALKGFQVEIWDWQKLDISIDTIQNVAPNVREVHLYSSGNNAVMRGWADSGGLPILKKVEKVCLHMNQGLEPIPRTEKNMKAFRKAVLDKCPNVQEVVLHDVIKVIPSSNAVEMNKEQIKEKQRWLDCIDLFKEFIKDYTRTLEEEKAQNQARTSTKTSSHNFQPIKQPYEPIKVALIDDGVEATHQELSRIIADGDTFCDSSSATGLYNSYYQSSGGHGTLMATFIRRVCPNVKLYVAKLEEQITDVGKFSFTVKSATEAIRWAIRSRVHIISMSWTIEKTDSDTEDVKELSQAINEAIDNNIILFCAAEDMGNNSTTGETYPKSCRPDKIFTIGAATASGNRWEWLGQGKVDYLLPGHELLPERQHGTYPGEQKARSGSSLATALASGLAALILYCAELCDHSYFELLRDHERMNRAFKNFGGVNEILGSDFVRVWTIFEKNLQAKPQLGGEQEVLESIMKALLR